MTAVSIFLIVVFSFSSRPVGPKSRYAAQALRDQPAFLGSGIVFGGPEGLLVAVGQVVGVFVCVALGDHVQIEQVARRARRRPACGRTCRCCPGSRPRHLAGAKVTGIVPLVNRDEGLVGVVLSVGLACVV